MTLRELLRTKPNTPRKFEILRYWSTAGNVLLGQARGEWIVNLPDGEIVEDLDAAGVWDLLDERLPRS